MKHLIIGTAGHVDHGKTALIHALTGTDTDRLKEEKERGISIDLGFASLALSEGIHAGIVDVPGHERFLKNMLAGTGGIDMAMLTIAADEGVMPQTREHLAMLQLYGVKHGVVVINKIDKVDKDWLELVSEDIRGVLTGTFLAAAPVCQVSAVTGEGLAALKEQLLLIAASLPARDSQAPFRMWIDRAFSVKGYGTVVTGTALSGTVCTGDSLVLYPSARLLRVRGLESHGVKADRISAGQRIAMNLSGVELEEIGRGMSVSAEARGETGRLWDILVDWRVQVETGCRVRLHLGTGEFIGRVYKPKQAPEGQYRLALETAVGAGAGDRGILRQYSPQYLLGGVMLLGAVREGDKRYPDKRRMGEAAEKNDGEAMAAAILEWQRFPVTLEEIKRRAGYMPDQLIERGLQALKASGLGISLERYYIGKRQLAEMEEQFILLLSEYHRSFPDKPGISKEEARQKLMWSEKTFELAAAYLVEKKAIVLTGAEAALPDHNEKHQDWRSNLASEAHRLLDGCGLENIDNQYIAQKSGMGLAQSQKFLEALVREGIVLRIGEIHVYRKTIQYIVVLMQRYFQSNETISVAQLRDMLNTSRKFALPLMEYMDMHKYTIRNGDVRLAGPKIKEFSEKTLF